MTHETTQQPMYWLPAWWDLSPPDIDFEAMKQALKAFGEAFHSAFEPVVDALQSLSECFDETSTSEQCDGPSCQQGLSSTRLRHPSHDAEFCGRACRNRWENNLHRRLEQ